MMKKILFLAGLFVSFFSNAQNFVQRSGPAVTAQDWRLAAKLNLYMPHTRGLTLNGGLDTLGAVIYDDSSAHVWYRDTVSGGGHKWSMILKTGDAGMGTVLQIVGGYGLLGGTITTSGTFIVDTAGLSNYWVRRHDSTIVFVTPTQMNAQGFLKTISGITAGGDLTGTYQNPTISLNAVSFAKFQQLPAFSFVANPTASVGNTQASYFKYGLIWNNDSIKVDTNTLKAIFGATGVAGITQLHGDGSAGPGSGDQLFTLTTVNGNVFGSNTFVKLAVNAKGLITGATTVVAGDITGALGYNPIPATFLSATSPIVYNNATGVISCPSCGVSGGGISSLNSLTAANQTFATGLSGTSPNILSSGTTHTFNNPLVSSLDTGIVTPALYATWNSKISLGSLSASTPLSYNSGTGNFTLQQGNTSQSGYISSTDWNTFNTKQNAGNYITGLTGDVTATGPGSVAATISAHAVTLGKMATNTANTLIGYDGSGNPIDVTVSTGLSLSAGVLTATGGGSQTLTYTQLALNNTLSISGGNTQTFLTATHALAGLMDTASKSVADSLRQRTYTWPTFPIYYTEGVSPLGNHGDSVQHGGILGAFFQPDTLYTMGFAYSITGLPSKSTALSTDSVMIEDANKKIWLLPVPSGGGGGGLTSFTSPNSTINIGGTLTAPTVDINLANANAWTATQGFTNINFSGTFLPTVNATQALGSGTLRFTSVFASNFLSAGDAVVGAASGAKARLEINGVDKFDVLSTGQLQVPAGYGTAFPGTTSDSVVTISGGNARVVPISSLPSGGIAQVYGIGQVGVKGTDSVYKTDSGWFRGPAYNAGVVIPATLQNLAEPSPIYDSAAVISATGPVICMLFTDDTLGVPQQNYAESKTGAPGTWTIVYNVIPGHYRGSMLKNAGFRYYFGVNTAETQVDEYVWSRANPTWTLLNAAVITASSLGTTNIYNNSVYINQATGTWYMLLDVNLLEYGYCDYGLTSTNNGATWTAVAGNPVLPKLAAPWLTYYAGKFYCWGLSSGTNAFLPSDVFEYSSTNFTGPWTMVQTGSVLHRLTNAEGVNGSQGQIADPALVSLSDSSTLMFVTIDPSGNQSAGDVIAAYRSPMSITQLITTSSQQNAPFAPEWEQLNGGQTVYNNGHVGIGTWAPGFPLYIGENPGNTIQGYPGASGAFAQNFISSTPFGHAISGFNLYHGTYGGWQLLDSTVNGYVWDGGSSTGLTAYYAAGGAGHSLSQPIPLGSWADASSHSVLSVGSIGALARIMINSTIDDGTGNTLQMNGYGATMGNIFGGKQFNGWYVGTNASTSAGSANISFFPSLNFAAGLTGTHNIFIDAGNTVLSGSSSNNIAIGTSNSTLLNGGSNNIDIGPSAFNSNVSGSFNTGMGQANLQSATGSHNSGFGDGSGRSITSGSYDLALGSETFYTDGIITSCATCVGSTAIGDSTQVLNSNTIAIGGEGSNQKFVGIDNPAPTAFFEVPAGTGVAGQSGFKFFAPSITTTAATGTGTAVTLTFATQPFIPFHVGQIIVVSGMVPSGYNGTYAVTICTLTTVTFLGSTTGSQTGAGTIVVTGKPASTETWALGPSGDTLWWIGPSHTLYALNFPTVSSVTASNGLTATGSNITLGGTLTGATTIDGGSSNFSLNLGNGSGNSLGSLNVNSNSVNFTVSGNISLAVGAGYLSIGGGLKESISQQSDANVTLSSVFAPILNLPVITANRTITLPTPSSSTSTQVYEFNNQNTAAFTWSFAGSTPTDLTGASYITIPNGAHVKIIGTSTNWYVVEAINGSGGPIKYQHTIFTPSTGGTVALVNNQNNIINPSGALVALTVNVPSSPVNNDVVYIKFTQTVSTVTYGNGTVVDGITAPTAGGLIVLTYDASTTSWY